MAPEFKAVLGENGFSIMTFVPSMAVGLLLIALTYRLAVKMLDEFVKPYIESQRQQAAAFMKVAEQLEASRITLSALAAKLDSIEDKINGAKK